MSVDLKAIRQSYYYEWISEKKTNNNWNECSNAILLLTTESFNVPKYVCKINMHCRN